MTSQLKRFLLTSSLFLSAQAIAQTSVDLNDKILHNIAQQYDVPVVVLEDFVESYDFKCPTALSPSNLVTILNTDDNDTELSIMLESNRLEWRDIYVEARAGISCLHEGIVSRGY